MIAFLFVLSVHAAEPTTTLKTEAPQKTTKPRWSVGGSFASPQNIFKISLVDPETGTLEDPLNVLEFLPTPNPITTLRVTYDHWGFSFSRKMQADEKDIAIYGPTDFDHTQFTHRDGGFIAEAFYSRFKGFHTDISIDKKMSTQIIVKRPDIRFLNFGAQVLQGTPDASNAIEVIYGQDDLLPQEDFWKWGWAFGGNINRMRFEGDTPFVPQQRKSVFGESSTLSGYASTSAGAGAGFGTSFVTGPSSRLGFLVIIGGSLMTSNAIFADREDSHFEMGSFSHARMAWKAYWQNHVFAFKVSSDNWNNDSRNVELSAGTTTAALEYAYKF